MRRPWTGRDISNAPHLALGSKALARGDDGNSGEWQWIQTAKVLSVAPMGEGAIADKWTH